MTVHLWDDDEDLRNDPDLPDVRLESGEAIAFLHPRTREFVTIVRGDLRANADEATRLRAQAREKVVRERLEAPPA